MLTVARSTYIRRRILIWENKTSLRVSVVIIFSFIVFHERGEFVVRLSFPDESGDNYIQTNKLRIKNYIYIYNEREGELIFRVQFYNCSSHLEI